MRKILMEKQQETIRKFLLGDLAESERAALEDGFLGDAEIFEQIEDAENDLVDDYVANRLRENERARFENYYLAQPENQSKVAAARALRKVATANPETEIIAAPSDARAGFWESIQNFFASFRLAPVMAAAVVLLFLVGGLWLVFRSPGTNEISQSPTPTPEPVNQIVQPSPQPTANANGAENSSRNAARPTPAATVQPNANAAPKETPRPAEPQREPPPQTAPPRQQTVTLALIAGLVRGNGEANKLILPKNARQVRLSFDLPAKNYREIEARIESVAGAEIWRGKIRQNNGRAALNLPAGLFADEDYLLIVSGLNAARNREDFQNFYFNSERK